MPRRSCIQQDVHSSQFGYPVGAWELLEDTAELCKVPQRGLLPHWSAKLGEVRGGHTSPGFRRIPEQVVLPFW
ncbi:hypothetical protein LINPERPRIM_LOCUS3758 [Linum perenne]